jgi:hypothetical protein
MQHISSVGHIASILSDEKLDSDEDNRHLTERVLVIAFLAILFWMVTELLPQSTNLVLGCDGSSLWSVHRSFFTITLSGTLQGEF